MRRRTLTSLYWGAVLLIIGVLFLARNLGYLDFWFSWRLHWPVILILVGGGWIVKSFGGSSGSADDKRER